MSEQNPDALTDRLEGKIDKYKVSVAHYGEGTDDVYLQVYLPDDEYRSDNHFYANYPSNEIIEIDPSWTEIHNSYGKLNQKGGQIGYHQYFPLPEKEVDQDKLIKIYQEKYQSESAYKFDEKTKSMAWQKEKYEITLTFSKNHGRVYLMMRQPVEK